MKTLKSLSAPLGRFLHDEKGATAIEYAMIAAGIGVAVAATVVALGAKLTDMYQSVVTKWPT
jgi:pilus assembly protein Flp/PilA